MLTRDEVRLNFATFEVLSWVNIFPFDVSYKTGRIFRHEQQWRRNIWKVWFIVSVLHEIFVTVRFIQSLIVPEYMRVSHAVIHATVVIGLALCIYMAKVLFIQWPYLSIKVFNELYYVQEKREKTKFQWRSYSLQEIITIFLFLVPFGPIPMITFLYYLQPNKMFHFYSLLSPGYQTQTMMWMLLVVEVLCLVNSASALMLGTFVMLSTFQKILWTAEIEEVSLGLARKLTSKRVEKSYLLCRKLQLMTQLFNQCYRNINYYFKVVGTVLSIGSLFFGIRYYEEHPYVSAVAFAISFECLLMFKVVYDGAFRFPEQFEELKDKLDVVSSRLLFGSAVTKKRILSIPNLSIQVGCYNALERNSTLLYYNFIATNLATALLTF